MRLSLSSKVFYRVPKFPYRSCLVEEWDSVKESIKEASPVFFETIADVKADSISVLPAGLGHTVWKYFNRAKFRATPYGSFAGFGLAPLCSGGLGIAVQAQQERKEFVDWTSAEDLKKSFEELLEKELWLIANSSHYQVGDCIRYLSNFEGSFQLSDLEVDDFQLKVLNLCRQPILFAELVQLLGLIPADYHLIEEMIGLQLLITGNDPNIIGEEYFKRVGCYYGGMSKYIIAERKYVEGAFDSDVFKALPDLAVLIAELTPVKTNENLKRFVTAFKNKFEGRRMPLMLALDPELGLGYGDMEESGGMDEFAGRFVGRQLNNNEDENGSEAELKKEMLRNMLGSVQKGFEVLDLEQLASGLSREQVTLPNTFSAICSVNDGLVSLDMLGGASANSLLGRFTLSNEEVTAYTRELAGLESEANPDVLFFDVAYMAEGRVDNINRRNRIYDLQLSILNYDTSAAPLELKDLYLCVVKDELILFSEKLGRRLIPRIASAYNYTRSDLSLFRLLCDLQNQGLQTGLSFSVAKLIPGLAFYPRVQYKNIIVNPAKWHVVYKEIDLLIVEEGNVYAVLRSHFTGIGMKQHLILRAADMTLCFDLFVDADLDTLLVLLKKQEKFYLEEAFIPMRSNVLDEEGRGYKSELVLALTHKERVYQPYVVPGGVGAENILLRRNFAPGSEWLYFEIYCHVYRSDVLLGELIAPFLVEYGRYIKSWFFIRYKENGDHLRLRILLHDAGSGQLLVSGLSAVLLEHLESGIVAELLMKTYKREVERYAAGGMEKVEAHFGVDSAYVLSLLGLDLGVMDKYKLCVWVVVSVMESGLISPVVFERLVGRICDSFAAEHKVEVAGFKELNNEYKVFKKFVPVALEGVALEHGNMFLSSLLSVLSGCDIGRRGQLFGDLMHMHVNRLFADQQRTHEMIMYYFLNKELLLRRAMVGKFKDKLSDQVSI